MSNGKTMKLILLNSEAFKKSKCNKCCIPLVIPHPGHSWSNNKTDKHIVCPLSKKLDGNIKSTIGINISPTKYNFMNLFFTCTILNLCNHHF